MTLAIRITRGRDDRDLIVCMREDGSSTWQRRPPGFGVLHDLMHLAVESAFGDLSRRWEALAPGESLELSFEPGGDPGSGE